MKRKGTVIKIKVQKQSRHAEEKGRWWDLVNIVMIQ